MRELAGVTVAVTGATGFLGTHLSRALLTAGANVVGVVRSPEKGAILQAEGVRFRKADLADVDALSAAFVDCDVVVANAALAVKGGAPYAAFRTANVDGVHRTFQAVQHAGVRRVLHISSVGVYQVRAGQKMAEDTPLRTRFRVDPSLLTTNWRYTLTKAEGERVAWQQAEAMGCGLTVFRPGPIYGSGDVKLLPKLIRRAERHSVWVPNVGLPLVHAGDIAQGVVAALASERSLGQAYNFGGNTHRLPDVIRTLATAMNTSCRVRTVPLGLGVRFDDSKAEKELGLNHRSLLDGFREAL